MTTILEPTEIQAFHTCPRLWSYRYVNQIVRKRVSVKLYLGSAVHAALAAHYSGEDWEPAYTRYVDTKLTEIQNQVNLTAEDYAEYQGNVELGWKIVRSYVDWAQENDPKTFAKVLHVEQSFKVPIPGFEDTYLAGRIDLLVEDHYGRIWVMDHKTCAQFPDQTTLRLDEQMGYYIWAVNQLFPDRKVAGVIYNAIRKTDPHRARAEMFRRFGIVRNGTEVESIDQNLRYATRQVLTMRRDGEAFANPYFPPHPGQHCSWRCGYTNLCIGTEDGSDTQVLIDTLYRQTDRINWLDEGE